MGVTKLPATGLASWAATPSNMLPFSWGWCYMRVRVRELSERLAIALGKHLALKLGSG